MIRRVEALNYRCLRYIDVSLDAFQVLVGPNATGKTTFLDAVAFLGDLVSCGLEQSIEKRTRNFEDLLWGRTGQRFELAVELEIPADRRMQLPNGLFSTVRYEVSIGLDDENGESSILAEKVLLKKELKPEIQQRLVFPIERTPPDTLISAPRKGARTVVNKVPGGNDNFYSEVHEKGGKGWMPAFKFGPRKSALGNLPADETKFPVAAWLKEFLSEGLQRLVLNSLIIRRASSPGQVRGFKPDGSNLPWVIENLKENAPERFRDWLEHLRTALPDIENVRTVERPDDKHRYLIIEYTGGMNVPSWMASDGTLRLMALTLPAYLPDFLGAYLIEEPENGIHPRAVETMFQSLSSAYSAQIFMATHSPVILSVADPSQILCFSKTGSGAADIVRGSEHPALKEWQGETNLGVLFAGGVLG